MGGGGGGRGRVLGRVFSFLNINSSSKYQFVPREMWLSSSITLCFISTCNHCHLLCVAVGLHQVRTGSESPPSTIGKVMSEEGT